MFMIHSCNDRKQYVEDFLIQSMLSQGIKRDEIILFNDDDGIGCLKSWVASCIFLNENYGDIGVWHLQDDVVIADDFYSRVKSFDGTNSIINGFVCKKHNPDNYKYIGWQDASQYWMSLQCVYIPCEYIKSFLKWFDDEIIEKGKYKRYYLRNRHADFFFYKSAQSCFPNKKIYNAFPCMVDHVDYLLGGSVITENKKYVREAAYWNEPRGVLKK